MRVVFGQEQKKGDAMVRHGMVWIDGWMDGWMDFKDRSSTQRRGVCVRNREGEGEGEGSEFAGRLA